MCTLRVKRLKGILAKTKGLIGKDNAEPVFFKTRFGIHTFGLKFGIDVLILDKEHKVVKIKKNLPPNHLFFWNPKYDAIIELPAGLVEKTNISLSEKVFFK